MFNLDYFEILLNYGRLTLPGMCDKHTLLDIPAIMQFNSVLVPAVPNTDDMPSIMVLWILGWDRTNANVQNATLKRKTCVKKHNLLWRWTKEYTVLATNS